MPVIPTTTKLSYTIDSATPIEASASTNADDLSLANITIKAVSRAGTEIKLADLHHINIVVRSSNQSGVGTTNKSEILTLRPRSITPVASEFNNWEIRFDSERKAKNDSDEDIAAPTYGEAVFRAIPVSDANTPATQVTIPAGKSISFTLRDVEVVDHDGDTVIDIEEFNTEGAKNPNAKFHLPLKKIFPGLRIERFEASPFSRNAGDSAAKLSWVTKGATSVSIEGDGANPRTGLANSGEHPVSPQTTTTYTLRADRAGAHPVTRQVTVTVKNRTVTPSLDVKPATGTEHVLDSTGLSAENAVLHLQKPSDPDTPPQSTEIHGSLTVDKGMTIGTTPTAPNSTPDALTVHGIATVDRGMTIGDSTKATSATPDVLTVQGKVTANSFEIGGVNVVPFGVIVMWSGTITSVPNGWTLCDGKTIKGPDGNNFLVPDLRDRFVLGAGGKRTPIPKGGNPNITLTASNIPSHDHGGQITTSSDGEHTHRFVHTDDTFDDDGNITGQQERSEQYNSVVGATGASNVTLAKGSGKNVNEHLFLSTKASHTHIVKLSAAGQATPAAIDIHPPYFVLAFIMKDLEKGSAQVITPATALP